MIVVKVADVLERTRLDHEALVIRLKVTPTLTESRRIAKLLKEQVGSRSAHYHQGDREVRILFPPYMIEPAIQELENQLTLMLAHHVFEARQKRMRRGR